MEYDVYNVAHSKGGRALPEPLSRIQEGFQVNALSDYCRSSDGLNLGLHVKICVVAEHSRIVSSFGTIHVFGGNHRMQG